MVHLTEKMPFEQQDLKEERSWAKWTEVTPGKGNSI